MKISQILRSNPVTISMEVFPPKSDVKLDSVRATVREIAQLRPAFVSCTYGAGGGTSQYTVEIARDIMEEGVASMAHLTCVSSTRDSVRSQIAKIREAGIENILALRGDIPKDMEFPSRRYYEHAIELVEQIRAEYPDACVGASTTRSTTITCIASGKPGSLSRSSPASCLSPAAGRWSAPSSSRDALFRPSSPLL